MCGCVCVCTSVSIQSVPPFAFEGVVSCLTDLPLPPVLTLPEAPVIGPGSCQSEPNPTHLVVIQPDSGLPWTAQPAHFSYASSLEPHCVSGLPHHTTAKRLRAERTHVISLTVQSAGQTFTPPLPPLILLSVCPSGVLRSPMATIGCTTLVEPDERFVRLL